MTSKLKDMQREVRGVNEANGWFDKDRDFAADIALLHSEVSEAFEAYRIKGNVEDQTIHPDGLPSETGYLPKPEGVGSELADVLVRLLDTCERYNIDLEWEFNRKLEYNKTRGYRHGNKVI